MKFCYFIFLILLASTVAWSPQSTVGTGAGAGSFTIGINPNNFGPPLYLAASTSTADPGAITPIFTSRAPSGTVNTVVPTTVNWASGDKFDGGNCVVGHKILIIAILFPIATCDSATQLHITGSINTASASAFAFIDKCIGDCQNSVKEDVTIPGHIAGTEKITRITDGGTMCGGGGVSVGNLSYTGGDNDYMVSRNGTYAAFFASGNDCIYHLSKAGGQIQVVNAGVPAGIRIAGTFGFSRTTDTDFYYLKLLKQIWHAHITSDSTFTESMVVDFLAPGVCPGVSGLTPVWTSALDFKDDDTRFALSIGPTGGQEHADWVFSWDTVLGCSTANFATGQAWNWSSIVCPGNTCSSSTPALGTMSTAITSCWGSNGATGKGIHSAAMSGDGLNLLVTPTTPWTQAGCAGHTEAAIGRAIWTPGTLSNVWCSNVVAPGPGNFKCGGHGSDGISHLVTPNSSGPNIRSYANVATFTQYAAPFGFTDSHGAWPHFCNGILDDNCAWINASDLVTAAQGGTNAPKYLNNVVFALWPTAIYPPGKTPSVFFHTFSCGWASNGYATCPVTGGDVSFGSQQSIGVVAPDGSMFCWASTMLHNLGTDNLGNPRADVFCGLLQ
jgi:hypothetical protein